MTDFDTRSQRTSAVRAWIGGMWLVAGLAGAAELTVQAVQDDGLPVAVDLCVTARTTSEMRCEPSAERDDSDSGVRFADLAAGAWVVTLAGDPMWQSDPVEVELPAEGRHTATIELTTRIDFSTLDTRFGRFWQVQFERLSGWGHGGTIEVVGYTTGKAQARWQAPRSTDPPIEIELTAAERDRFVDALQRARLFSGGHVGTDTTPVDGPFDTLRVSNGAATAILVTSGNPSFAVGARKELIQSLDALRDRLEARRGGR